MEYGGVSVSLSVHLRETYDEIKAVSNLLKYHEHNWILFVDLKMVSFVLGQQRGFTILVVPFGKALHEHSEKCGQAAYLQW